MKNNIPTDFSADQVHNLVIRELKILSRVKTAFNYVYDNLVQNGFHIEITPDDVLDLDSVKTDEGKNYNWFAISCGAVQLVIRQYGQHQTIYTKLTEVQTYGKGKDKQEFNHHNYGCLTFNTVLDGMQDRLHDSYIDYPMTELNKVLHSLIAIIAKNELHTLWNNLCFPRPDFCEVKSAFAREQIYSMDALIFCAEEIIENHMGMFAQTDMLEMLKTLETKNVIGEVFDHNSIVKSISTEFPKQYSDPYYHGVGLTTVSQEDKTKFIDVYSLTRWYAENIMELMSK